MDSLKEQNSMYKNLTQIHEELYWLHTGEHLTHKIHLVVYCNLHSITQ